MSGTTRLERGGGITTLWLDNPERRNAFDVAMLEALARAAAEVAGDPTIDVVLLRGVGSLAFSAGADVTAFVGADGEAGFITHYRAMEMALEAAVAALAALPQPLVAGIAGACMGGAVQLALCADIRVADDTLKLAVPAASLGLVYPLDAIEKLIALCGPAATKLMFMTGRVFTAEEALRAGLVDLVEGQDGFDEALAALCGRIAGQPKATVAAYKSVVDAFVRGADPASLRALQDSVNLSSETAALIAAAATKRRRRD